MALTLRHSDGREEKVIASASSEGAEMVGGALAASLSPLTWRKLMLVRCRLRARSLEGAILLPRQSILLRRSFARPRRQPLA